MAAASDIANQRRGGDDDASATGTGTTAGTEPTTTTTTTTELTAAAATAPAPAPAKTPPPAAPLPRLLTGAAIAGGVGAMPARTCDVPDTCPYGYSSEYKCIVKDFPFPPPSTQCDACSLPPDVHHMCFTEAAPWFPEGSHRQCCICLTASIAGDAAEDALFAATIDCDNLALHDHE